MTTTAIRTEGLPRHGLLGRLKIRGRILAGFGVLLQLLAVSVGITLVKVLEIHDEGEYLTELRLPSSEALDETRYRLTAAEVALRDIVLFQDDGARAEHDRQWRELDQETQRLDRLAANWTVPEQVRNWDLLKRKMATLHRLQEDLENALTTGTIDRAAAEARLREQIWPANRDAMVTLAGEINPATDRREGGLMTQLDTLTIATGADVGRLVDLLMTIE